MSENQHNTVILGWTGRTIDPSHGMPCNSCVLSRKTWPSQVCWRSTLCHGLPSFLVWRWSLKSTEISRFLHNERANRVRQTGCKIFVPGEAHAVFHLFAQPIAWLIPRSIWYAFRHDGWCGRVWEQSDPCIFFMRQCEHAKGNFLVKLMGASSTKGSGGISADERPAARRSPFVAPGVHANRPRV